MEPERGRSRTSGPRPRLTLVLCLRSGLSLSLAEWAGASTKGTLA